MIVRFILLVHLFIQNFIKASNFCMLQMYVPVEVIKKWQFEFLVCRIIVATHSCFKISKWFFFFLTFEREKQNAVRKLLRCRCSVLCGVTHKASFNSSKLAAVVWGLVWLQEGHLCCVWKAAARHCTLEDHAMRFQFLGLSEEPSRRNTSKGTTPKAAWEEDGKCNHLRVVRTPGTVWIVIVQDSRPFPVETISCFPFQATQKYELAFLAKEVACF